MLTREDNELLARTGPGTPMGKLMRRYWLPVTLAWEVPVPDSPPVRVRLLGEDLILFRTTSGTVGLIQNACMHRGASLFFGRNEEDGLRCVYHGWKYDVTGQCVDMPNEPAESNFKAKIRATAYPCVERNGVIWAYLGLPQQQPTFPELEWTWVPPDHAHPSKRLQECNWLQAMEGGIDSSHISFLHGGRPPAVVREDPSQRLSTRDTAPVFEVVNTDYGLLIGARRNAPDDQYYWRITQWLFPWYTMIPPGGEGGIGGHAWIPADDETCWAWSFSWNPARPHTPEQRESFGNGSGIHADLIPGSFRPKPNRDNDYLIDREAQRTRNFTGIYGIGTQDCAVQESMGPVFDRRREHLGTSDAAIVSARRRLLTAVKNHEQGIEPPALDGEMYKVRSHSTLLPKGVAWAEGAREGLVARPGELIPSVSMGGPTPQSR